ncbi:hypothetical protein [Agromyces seonyuensis]|uniref:Uncharacterized protein n=1 Tax=Agromyces seonyuensis TaxID=2662446 RepID=A0A6I4NXB7_9MICO|nr:hypothetical protein [Agromyces seonyuensis]MWB98831.1 hypothetical protein [Agromyces seonyuensis]
MFRRPRKVSEYPRDPNVPEMGSWGTRGISGTIGVGPQTGEYVIAARLDGDQRDRPDVPRSMYELWFPTESLTEPDGTTFLMDSGVVDEARENGSGGLIDVLTSRLRVQWDADDAAFERALSWYREHIWGSA